MSDLFWPVRDGAVGETLVGPFNSQEEAQSAATKITEQSGVTVWVTQISSDAL